MEDLLNLLRELASVARTMPDTTVIVVCENPEHGRGGIVRVPEGAYTDLNVIGLLGALALSDDAEDHDPLFEQIGSLLFSPEPGEA